MSNKKNGAKQSDDIYFKVLMAIDYVRRIEEEEEKRAIAQRKTKRAMCWLTLIGATILIALSLITNFHFDISWAASAGKWYSDLYVSLMTYIVITDIILILERRFKLNQKPLFGYIWPFAGFLISMFLTNTLHVEISSGEPRTTISLFIIFLVPSTLLMISSYRVGKQIAVEKNKTTNNAIKLINDNPDVVKKVFDDYETYKKNKEK